MATIYDLNNTKSITALLAALDKGIVNNETLTTALATVSGAMNAPLSITDVTLSAGVAAYTRYQFLTVMRVYTEGALPQDDLEEIAVANGKDGDLLLIIPNENLRLVNIYDGNNIQMTTSSMRITKSILNRYSLMLLVFVGGQFMEIGRIQDPDYGALGLRTDLHTVSQFVTTSQISAGSITPLSSFVNVLGAKTGAVDSAANFTFAGGYPATGTYAVDISYGVGSFRIASGSFTGVASANALATLVRANISAYGTSYTPSGAGANVIVTATGMEDTVNGYVITPSLTFTVGTPSVVVGSNFAGGVAGTYTNTDLDTIVFNNFNVSPDRVQRVQLFNGMTAGAHIQLVAGGNINQEANIDAGQTIEVKGNYGSTVDIVGAYRAYESIRVNPGQIVYGAGNRNCGLGAYVSGNAAITDYTNELYEFVQLQQNLNQYIGANFKIPENFVGKSTITVTAYIRSGAGDAYFDWGFARTATGEAATAIVWRTQQIVTIPGTGELVEVQGTINPATGVTYLAGDLATVCLSRNGLPGADTATDVNVLYLEIRIPINIG